MPHQQMAINPNGRILWEGVSPFDGSPIVCIVTGLAEGSANGKTGTMLQTWILPRDVKPHHGFKDGRGASVCGDCPHAGYNQGSCYVKWFHAPLSVWNAYHRGSYEPIEQDWHIFTGRAVRFGAAGDPAMVPAEIWQRILEFCASHTGYTHQWRQPWAQGLRGICQASCDGFADYMAASDAGWRCFLVAPKGATAPKGMAHCAASIERGQKTTCQACTLCDGASADVFINAHGASAGKVIA